MDAATFRADLAATKRTELDRLGSNKLLVAVTGADLSTEAVLRVAADSENAAHNTFAGWAEDESDEDARDAFAAVAEQERAHLDRVMAELEELNETNETDEPYEPADGGAIHEYLRGRDEAVQRVAAGMVGRSLVVDQTHKQLVSFFVNEADERRANLFRDLRSETEDTLDAGLELLDALCTTDEDWEDAQAVAAYVIQVAYDDYEDSLRGMGIDPKPVC
jgi:rubrerythrin